MAGANAEFHSGRRFSPTWSNSCQPETVIDLGGRCVGTDPLEPAVGGGAGLKRVGHLSLRGLFAPAHRSAACVRPGSQERSTSFELARRSGRAGQNQLVGLDPTECSAASPRRTRLSGGVGGQQ